MLILWICIFFLAEPLILMVSGLLMAARKDHQTELPRFALELIMACYVVAIVMLCLDLTDVLGSAVKAAGTVIGLVVAKSILRPIIAGAVELLLVPFEGASRGSYPSTTARPWINPGSAPPPGWSDEIR